ncbi:hypothetical protein [Streptomyces hawaiiensis]|uniref:hypothetical protein n=1 Tax=Streptomyces hawaiiensis TaxID=67305 RepID=UPI001FEBCC76|nr:hypothetical protein [Streptomyces hawaiiensis]
MLVTVALGRRGVRRQGSMRGDEAVTYQVAHRSQLVGLAAMAVVGVWCARGPLPARGPIRLPAPALPLLILPAALLLLLALVKPLFVDRYVLYSTIGFALLLGAWLDGSAPVSRSTRGTASRAPPDDEVTAGRPPHQKAGADCSAGWFWRRAPSTASRSRS